MLVANLKPLYWTLWPHWFRYSIDSTNVLIANLKSLYWALWPRSIRYVFLSDKKLFLYKTVSNILYFCPICSVSLIHFLLLHVVVLFSHFKDKKSATHTFLTFPHPPRFPSLGSQVGVVVISPPSHLYNPGSSPHVGWYLSISIWLRGFFSGYSGFPPSANPTFTPRSEPSSD